MGMCSGQSKKPKQSSQQIQFERKMKLALESKQNVITNRNQMDNIPVLSQMPIISQMPLISNIIHEENFDPNLSIKSINERLEYQDAIDKQNLGSPKNLDDDIFDLERPSSEEDENSIINMNEKQKMYLTQPGGIQKPKQIKKVVKSSQFDDSDDDNYAINPQIRPAELQHLPLPHKNLFKTTDYECDIVGIKIIRLLQEGIPCYELKFRIKYHNHEHVLITRGILKENLNTTYLDLQETSAYDIATKNSQVPCFFQQSNYFDATQDHPDHSILFSYMMLVKRRYFNRKNDTKKENDPRLKLGFEPPIPQYISQEMLEIMNVYDFQLQQNLKNVLFSKLIAKNYPQFKDEVVTISNLLFVFDSEPILDMPQPAQLCIFYNEITYSLNTLLNFCTLEHFMIDEDYVANMALKLITTLIKYYKANFYRLNFTLDTVFYSNLDRNYKINWYNRLKCLTGIMPNSSISEVKQRDFDSYVKAFQQDQEAIVNILLLFMTLRNQKITIEELRSLSIQTKLELIQSLKQKTTHEKLPLFLTSCYNLDIKTYQDIQTRLGVLKTMIIDMVGQEHKNKNEEFQLTMKTRQDRLKVIERQHLLESQRQTPKESQRQTPKESLRLIKPEIQNVDEISNEYSAPSMSEDSSSDDEEISPTNQNEGALIEILPSMNIKFSEVYNAQGLCYGQRPEVISEYEMHYRKLFVHCIFRAADYDSIKLQIGVLLDEYILQLKINPLQEIMASRFVIVLNFQEQYYAYKEKKSTKQILRTKKSYGRDMSKILLRQQKTATDPIYFVALTVAIQLLLKNHEYEYLKLILSRFRVSIQHQNELKKDLTSRREAGDRVRPFTAQDQHDGIIQVRKFVYIGLYQAMMEIQKKNFSQSSLIVQNMLKVQVQFHLDESVAYGFSVFLNGMVNHEALAISTAMLNYAIAKTIYLTFFDEQHLVIANIDFKLGEVNMIQKDFDSAVKSFANTYKLRQIYYQPVDDVILEVLIKLLKGYVELDDVSLAIQLCHKYMALAKNDPLIRNCKSKQYSQFQLVLACIYQSLGSFISAILCFQRSHKCLSQANLYDSLLNYYIWYKRKCCLTEMYTKALVANNIIGVTRDSIYTQQGFMSMNDVANHCFPGVSQVTLIPKNQRSSKLCLEMAFASYQFHRKRYDASKAHYNQCLAEARPKKKDLKYGLILLKLAQIDLIQHRYKEGIVRMIHSIEFFQLFMVIPQKQLAIIKCYCYLSVAYVLTGDREGYMNAFEEADKIRHRFQQRVGYSMLSKIHQTHAHLPNKYEILTRTFGYKFSYMMLDLLHIIQHMMLFRKTIVESPVNLHEKLAWEYHSILNADDKQQQQILKKREANLYGIHVKLVLHKTVAKIKKNQKSFAVDVDKPLKIPKLKNSPKGRKTQAEAGPQNKLDKIKPQRVTLMQAQEVSSVSDATKSKPTLEKPTITTRKIDQNDKTYKDTPSVMYIVQPDKDARDDDKFNPFQKIIRTTMKK